MQISLNIPNIMANSRDSNSEIIELIKEAKENYQNSMGMIVENKKYLTKMFDDLSSAYDNLDRKINEKMDVMKKILASDLQFQGPLGTASVLEALKSSFNLSSHKFSEEMMIAKRKQLTEAQQVNPVPNF